MKRQLLGHRVPPTLKQDWPANKVKQEPPEHIYLHRGVKPDLAVGADEPYESFVREPECELTIQDHAVQLPETYARYNLEEMMMMQSHKADAGCPATVDRRGTSVSAVRHVCDERSAPPCELKVPVCSHVGRNVEETLCNKSTNTLSQNLHLTGESYVDRHSEHLNTDTEKKLFRCDTCGKSCTSSTGLKLHVRIHTPKKPYACQMCDKSFLVISQLRKHIRSHKIDKPYLYHVCNGSCTM